MSDTPRFDALMLSIQERVSVNDNATKAAGMILFARQLELELSAAEARIRELQRHAANLTEIVRMPNAEHIADAHNAAVRFLRGEGK